jgi:glycosyltransferase involved in cell wall biosynthesis
VAPLVSVIIPTRNRGDKLPRALDSVLGQEGLGSLFHVQIIVIDDASFDNTPTIAHRYPDIQYFRLDTQQGVAAARNVGLKASLGKYIAFLDDDDVWLPHKLRVQVVALEEHNDVAVVYSQAVMFQGASPAGLAPEASCAPSGPVFLALLLRGSFCPNLAALLLRRDVFETVGYFDEQLRAIEDFDLYLRIAFHYPFQFVPGAVCVYHSTAQGLYFTQVRAGSAAEDGRKVVHRALQRLPNTPKNKKLRRDVLLLTEAKSILRKSLFASPEAKWRTTLTVLGSLPEILRYRWGREAATNVVPLIVASDAPIAAGRRWCSELRVAAAGKSLAHWFRMQLTVAAIWTATALELGRQSVVNIRAARAAAMLAILHNPAKLRVKELRWLIVGAALRNAGPSNNGEDSGSLVRS